MGKIPYENTIYKNKKRASDSYTEQVQVLTQSNLNGYNRLFGGQLMSWIDVVAAVVARRHANCNVTTAGISALTFSGPAFANEMVLLCGHITYVGNSSMEVCVKTFVENLDGTRRLINTAYLTMVAIDENGKSVKVPGLIIETPEQQTEWDEAVMRRVFRENDKK